MSTFQTFQKWLCEFLEKQGQDPEFIPVTPDEIRAIVQEAGPNCSSVYTPSAEPDISIMGCKADITPFAEGKRCKSSTIPCAVLSETVEIPTEFYTDRGVHGELLRRLSATILRETTTLDIVFEWDRWAWLKRVLGLTRWFPVKTQKARIEARVLYPFVQVTLPANRHRVCFSASP